MVNRGQLARGDDQRRRLAEGARGVDPVEIARIHLAIVVDVLPHVHVIGAGRELIDREGPHGAAAKDCRLLHPSVVGPVRQAAVDRRTSIGRIRRAARLHGDGSLKPRCARRRGWIVLSAAADHKHHCQQSANDARPVRNSHARPPCGSHEGPSHNPIALWSEPVPRRAVQPSDPEPVKRQVCGRRARTKMEVERKASGVLARANTVRRKSRPSQRGRAASMGAVR